MRFSIHFALLILFLASCTTEDKTVVNQDFSEKMDVEIAEDVVLLYSDSASLKAKIMGEELRRYVMGSDPYDEFINGVVVEFFSKNGTVESTMTSDYAIRYERSKEVIARDEKGVILSNTKRDSLVSTELIWDEKNNRIYTKRFVKISRPDRIIWGYGFESDQDFSRGKIQAIEGEMLVEDFVPPSESEKD